MIRRSFNADWTVGPAATGFASLSGKPADRTPVTLPHDAVRDQPRSADAADGSNTGYVPGGHFDYSKTFDVPADYRDKTVILEFEGVYRDAMVYLNGDFAAQRPNGYAGFYVVADPYLRYGQTNTIRVEARAHRDSRWYSGAGIYRDTHLLVADPVHVVPDGVRIRTPDVDDERAVVALAIPVRNATRHTATVRVRTTLHDADGTVAATGQTPLTLLPDTTSTARLRLYLPKPKRWSVDQPTLYQAHTTVSEDDDLLDEDQTTFGIRTLRLDPTHGLRINDDTVELRGACIHHDAGLLGSAAIGRADERRVQLLKRAGFNAIRSAHNNVSKTTLDACDRFGMLVLDETFDVWTEAKTPFDYSLAFPEWWERDVEAMVAKDFNHPSVIMYSIGNEIFETGRPIGSSWGRRLAEKIRGLDDTRFVTNSINGFVSVLDEMAAAMAAATDQAGDVNAAMSSADDFMSELSASAQVTAATEESHAIVDVAGLNYGDSRYLADRDEFPNRVILGTETFPNHIDELWRLVRANAHVIGDFTWTGWDYLGEAGIGRVEYPDAGSAAGGFVGAFPWRTAWCGDIDITGHRRPMSYYRETVFGLRHQPYVAVHRPQFHGRQATHTPWSWSDSVSSWSWAVPPGSPVTVDVYSDADEVELVCNGEPVGRVRVGADKACLTRFDTTYQPGNLLAVAYVGGREQARTSLRTAGEPTRLATYPDRTDIRADDTDLAYVDLVLEDGVGDVATHADRAVTVDIEGAGVLAGLGSARPASEESFGARTCTTFDGRALAVIRPTGTGDIRVRVTADGLPPSQATVHCS